MSVRESDNPKLHARIQEQNLLRQYDLLANCVEIAVEKGDRVIRQVHSMVAKCCSGFEYCSIWREISRRADLCGQPHSASF